MKSDDFVKYFSRHFVSLGWFDSSPAVAAENDGRGRNFSTSGFVVSVNDVWYLITAGHILDDIQKAIAEGQFLHGFRIDDGWGPNAKYEPQVFDFAGADKLHHHSEELGTDFGAIRLGPNIRGRLAANGVEPLEEKTWKTVPNDCQIYFVVGLPGEWQTTTPLLRALSIRATLVLFGIDKIDPPAELIKPLDRLYFKRADELKDDAGEALESLDGMSGSPIFGATQRGNGFYYRLLGIQSGVDTATGRVMIVAPFLPLGLFLAGFERAQVNPDPMYIGEAIN